MNGQEWIQLVKSWSKSGQKLIKMITSQTFVKILLKQTKLGQKMVQNCQTLIKNGRKLVKNLLKLIEDSQKLCESWLEPLTLVN
jgi:hypothetical protein